MKPSKQIVLEGLWVDSMDALKKELPKAMGLKPPDVRFDHFEEDLLPWIQQLGGSPLELIWKNHYISCQKMRHTLVPVIIKYITLEGEYSNMMRDAVNGDADAAAARHHEESQAPLDGLLAEIEAMFTRLGIHITYD